MTNEDESTRTKSGSSSSRLQCYCSSRAAGNVLETPLTMSTLTTATSAVKVTGLSVISNFGMGISKGIGRQASSIVDSRCDTDKSSINSNNPFGQTDRKDGQIFAFMTHLGIYHGPLHLYDTYVQ